MRLAWTQRLARRAGRLSSIFTSRGHQFMIMSRKVSWCPGRRTTPGSNWGSGRLGIPEISVRRSKITWSGRSWRRRRGWAPVSVRTVSLHSPTAHASNIDAADASDCVDGITRDPTRPRHVAQIRGGRGRQALSESSEYVPLGLRPWSVRTTVHQLARPARGKGAAPTAPGESLGSVDLVRVVDRVRDLPPAR
jgi:hypothetical protein